MGYGFISDNQGRKGFINKETILSQFEEEDIFSLVFGYRPVINTYVLSPFRRDNLPNCWFSRSPDGRLRFVDFANINIMYGIKMTNIDCFDAVQIFFKLPNFYLTLSFIQNKLKKKKLHKPLKREVTVPLKTRVEMFFEARNFIGRDGEYWSPYGITREHLMEDNVFPVSRIVMKNTKIGDTDNRVRETCYAITGFEERIKFYFPFRKGKKRFLTNCTHNDIGNLKNLPPYGRQLIITKAYKDKRVLLNTGRYTSWNQNEGMEPDDEFLFPMVKGFNKVIVLFDNDRQGIQASKKLSDRINQHFPLKSRALWIPEHFNPKGIKDPSDLRKRSEKDLNEFLYNNSI